MPGHGCTLEYGFDERRGDPMSEITVRPATPADAAAICAIYNQGIEDRIATLETELRTPEERRQWLAERGPRHPVIVAEVDGAVVGWGSQGITSSRQIERRCHEDLAFMYLSADAQPDHDTICAFRRQHLATFEPLFLETLRVARAAPPARLCLSTGQLFPQESRRRTEQRPARDHDEAGSPVPLDYCSANVHFPDKLLARELGYHKLVLSAFPWNDGGMALYRKFDFRTVGVYREQGKLDGRWVDTIIMEKIIE